MFFHYKLVFQKIETLLFIFILISKVCTQSEKKYNYHIRILENVCGISTAVNNINGNYEPVNLMHKIFITKDHFFNTNFHLKIYIFSLILDTT